VSQKGKEIELDESDREILEMVLDEDRIEALMIEFETDLVKALVEKLGLEWPECFLEETEELNNNEL